ncbi:hypothetical protein pVco7_gp112 [Vibrio phage pVco-7]|uniref:Uncharacterized protein n=1 Tax=Vibrio phage pVco-5 TaxID=1965485 RepID=A0A1W6JV06_9CAUD|nr:hypothetical protein KNT61_gp113 [Vibrio phage pVco-5]ARM71101.1 hypothetical protein pVco5_112 [Vibrio phage pVco-5]
MAITWRNVAAPDMSGASRALSAAGQSFDAAISNIVGLAQGQRQANIAQEEQRSALNTQEAREAIQNIKTIEQYQNTSFEDLVSKYGQEVDREDLFKAFDTRDEAIYADQAKQAERALQADMRSTSGMVDNYVSEGLLGGKSQEQLKAGLEALIRDKSPEVKAAARNQFLGQLEYANELTPEGNMMYNQAITAIDTAYQVQEQNLMDKLAEQQAIVDTDPLKASNDLRSEMSWTEYANKYAPDKFEFFSYGDYTGEDIQEVVRDAAKDDDVIEAVRNRLGLSKKQMAGYTIPEDVFAHVIMTAPRTADNELRLGDFEDRVVDIAAKYYAYGQDAQVAKKNIRSLRDTQIRLGEQKSKELLKARDRVKNYKVSKSNIIGK